jgi:formate C-acetyltransferase
MTTKDVENVTIPGIEEPFSLELPQEIAELRDRARSAQAGHCPGIAEFALVDAQTWRSCPAEEDWQLWRARRCAQRLRFMPIDLELGERIVGKPVFRDLTTEERQELEQARKTLPAMPPYPGGDAGHFHPDYVKLFSTGICGIIEEIRSRQSQLGLTDEQSAFYEACRIAMTGMSGFARRVAAACETMAGIQKANPRPWRKLAAICRRVSTEPPTTFHEAVQLMFLALIALWFGDDHYLTTPGRMDQTLWPFYEADIASGRITRREAFEVICCLYVQLNRILWPGSAVSVMVGGRDGQGRDVTNELTYLCLAARLATRLIYPTVGVACHRGTPDELMDFCTRMVATGVGDPAFFNDEEISLGLRENGVSEADSFNYMNSTCVEVKVVGASNMWVTQPYINLPKGALNVLQRIAGGESPEPETFDGFQDLVRADLAGTIRSAAQTLDRVWKERGRTVCYPLASCLISDCLERGLDFDRGGARYNWVENSFVGLANLVDGLLAIQHLVFQHKLLSLKDLQQVLQADFAGHEDLRRRILNTLPKYGNDNEEADALAKDWADFLIASTESNTVGLHHYVPGFFCWIMHERLGSETGATPDGRRAGMPLADGAGAAQGRERSGPTASVLSTTKWSHRRVLGGLVHNAKFSKSLFKTDADRKALRNVIETYLKRGGFEMQINVVGKETLLDARAHPERYPDLLVRVAGYSDYFVHLNDKMQQEIIDRTEHAV